MDPAEVLREHPNTGYSTGSFADTRGDWETAFARAEDFSRNVVELSVLSQDELGSLADFLITFDDIVQIKHLSLHAPAKDLNGHERRRVALTAAVASMGVESVIVHPDVVGSMSVYAEAFGHKLVIENLDSRKNCAQTAADIKVPREAGFCLDLAHVKTVDPSMSEAHRMLDKFGDRLRQIHISSIDAAGHHIALTKADFELYGPVLEFCEHVPWVLEGYQS